MNELATAALAYAAYGWSIIPVRKNKKAAVKWHKYQKRRPSPDEVKSMLSIRGVTGCAVILGKISGNLACRDFDKPGAYESWAAAHPAEAAHLPTVKTPRPGFHVYFTAENVRTSKFDDGELRGEGAYTLLPPSLHGETGKRYEWLIALNGTVERQLQHPSGLDLLQHVYTSISSASKAAPNVFPWASVRSETVPPPPNA